MLRARGLGWCGMGLAAVLSAVLLSAEICRGQALSLPVDPPPTEAEAKIAAALDAKAEFQFVETPLGDVAAFLGELHGVTVIPDRKALEASGVDVNAPVTLQLGGVTLRSALRIMLDELHLTYAIHNEVLYITTPSAARGMADVRVYDVSQLLAPGDSADDLARTLTESLAAPSETVVPVSSRPVATPDEVLAELHAGGQQPSRSITAYQQMLIVRDTTLGHRELTAALLAIQAGAIRNAEAIRRAQEEAMKAANPTPMPPMPMPPEGEEPGARPEPEVRDS